MERLANLDLEEFALDMLRNNEGRILEYLDTKNEHVLEVTKDFIERGIMDGLGIVQAAANIILEAKEQCIKDIVDEERSMDEVLLILTPHDDGYLNVVAELLDLEPQNLDADSYLYEIVDRIQKLVTKEDIEAEEQLREKIDKNQDLVYTWAEENGEDGGELWDQFETTLSRKQLADEFYIRQSLETY